MAALLISSFLPQAALAAPSVGSVTPTTVSAFTPVTLSATVSASGGIQYCRLYVESEDVGPMTVTGSTASRSHTFSRAGVHTVFVFCKDNANVGASGPNTSVFVQSSGSSGDTNPPNVSAITPTIATANVPVILSANYTDVGSGVVSCDLYVNGTKDGAMTLTAGVATKERVFNAVGTATAYALCTDGAGNAGQGAVTTVTVGGTTSAAGKLVKLECPAAAAADHPCKAVYYIGADGKRHAFPNSKIFFTWYANFNEVETITPAAMSAYPLGKNVKYRPGVRMVKFTTLNNVYAVSKTGLRWVTSESIATALYGADWNTKIDDIPDTFYGDYAFGLDITDVTQYNVQTELSGAATIDAVL